MPLIAPYLPLNPLLPGPNGDKDAEGMKKQVPSSNIGNDIKRKGRSFEISDGELKLRDITKSINPGIPMIWAMFSTERFNEISTERTKTRRDRFVRVALFSLPLWSDDAP